MENGLCECGCGKETAMIKYPSKGIVGTRKRFCHGHHVFGSRNPNWNGGVMLDHDYKRIPNTEHPRSTKGYVLEHILIAEKVLGKPIPLGVVIHHVDGSKGKKDPLAIVICQNQSYHALIEARIRAYQGCGHPDWRKCCFCHNWDDPLNLKIRGNGKRACHLECERDYQRNRKS